jgi:murein DD-endopeptidase MepM/ murein hydrolase activator NlpD
LETRRFRKSALIKAILALGIFGAGCSHRRATPELPAGLEREHREPDIVPLRHTVLAGQTLYRIAQMYGVTPNGLAAANGISDPTQVAVGQELLIPIADRPDLPGSDSERARVDPTQGGTPTGRGPTRDPNHRGELQWPLRGILYARFGKKGKDLHDGIDLAAPVGTPVKAAQAGAIIYAGDQKGYGLIAIIAHENGLVTLYAHNHTLRVKTGQKVQSGQVIATVGESGRTTGPHLHFEVRKDGVPVDPLEHLGPVPQ